MDIYVSRLALLIALLDELLLFTTPAIVAVALYALGFIPLWITAAIATPSLTISIYVAWKISRESSSYPNLSVGVVVEDLKPEGVVKVWGEYWRAVCVGCRLPAGSCVEIVEVKEGRVYVKPVSGGDSTTPKCSSSR